MTHNFKNNYRSADGAGDTQMKKDILLSEIAKLLVQYPARVEMHLRKVGYKVPEGVSQSRLIQLTTDAFHSSRRFTNAVVRDIIGKKMSADGDDGNNYGDLLGKGADLVNSLGGLFGGTKKAQAETEKAKYEAEKAKADAAKALADKTKAVNAASGATSHIGRNILIALGVSSLIGGIILAVKQFNRA